MIRTRVAKSTVHAAMVLQWDCPACKMPHETPFELSDIQGGCGGHGDGEYCYCPREEYRETLSCASCREAVDVWAS